MGKEGLFSSKKNSSRSHTSNSHRNDENYDEETRNSNSSVRTPTKAAPSSSRKNRTPGRKLFQRLFACGSPTQKGGVLSASSLEDNKSSPIVTDISTESQSDRAVPSPPDVTRTLHNDYDENNHNNHHNTMIGLKSPMLTGSPATRGVGNQPRTPTSVPLPDSPLSSGNGNGRTRSTEVFEKLLKTTSPDAMMEHIFLTETTSSSYSESTPSMAEPHNDPSINSGTSSGTPELQRQPYGPHHHNHHHNHHAAMRPPGMAILTPQVNRLHHDDESDTTCANLFPYPLPTVSESPRLEVTHIQLSQSVSESNNNDDHDADDDAAYLPDDFARTNTTYTWEQVQKFVHDAESSLGDHWEDRHQHALEEFQEEAEKALAEHGSQWKKEADAEYKRMDTLVKEEKAKTWQKHRDLLLHTTEMSALQEQLEHQAKETEQYLAKSASLEAKLNQSDHAKELYQSQLNQEIQAQQEQLVTLRRGNNNVDELKSRHEQELQAVQDGKDEADQRVVLFEEHIRALEDQVFSQLPSHDDNDQGNDNAEELERYQQELRNLQASKDEANQQVLELQEQVNDLRQQVDSSNMEELIIMKAEKAAAERQIHELQEQWDSRIGINKNTQAQLRDAEAEIATLKEQLLQDNNNNNNHCVEQDQFNISAISDLSQYEELFAAKAEVETLRQLRAEDQRDRQEHIDALVKERDDLRFTLNRVEQQYQTELSSPRKKGRESTVEIRALTIEVEPSPRKSNSKNYRDTTNDEASEKRLKIMEQEFEKLRAERDALESQLHRLQEKQSKELKMAVQQARQELETQVQLLKDEMGQQSKEFEANKRSIQENLTVEEIEELTAQVKELKRRHEEEMEEHMESAIGDLEKARNAEEVRTKKLLAGFEVEKRKLSLTLSLTMTLTELQVQHQQEMKTVEAKSKEEIDWLHTKLDKFNEEHKEDLVSIQQKASEELENELQLLQARMDMERVKYEKEKYEEMKASEQECDDLRVRLVEIKQAMDTNIEEAKEQTRVDSAKKMEELTTQLEKVRADADARSHTVTAQYIKEMQAKFEEDTDDVKTKAKEDLDALQMTLDALRSEKQELVAKAAELESKLGNMERKHKSDLERTNNEAKEEMEGELRALENTINTMEMGDSELSKKVAELQAKTEADRIEYSRRVREVREEQSKEIEELLSQLDLIEAEHNARYMQKEKLIKEKDAVISALGSQLAEAQCRLGAMHETQEALAADMEVLRERLDQARAETEARTRGMERLLVDHEKAMEQETLMREKACEEAREEMIQRAEGHHEQANETYKKLKHQFDNAVSKISGLERDLRLAKKEAEEIRKRQEACEVDLADELAQAKAAIATSDLQATRKVRQYRSELERSKESEKEMREKLDEALSTSRSVQSALASVVAEKEKLIVESNDMKAVCEELMALVEGNEQG